MRVIRIYIHANSQKFEGLRQFYSDGNERSFINLLLPLILFSSLLAIVSLLAIKGRAAVVHPIFIGTVLFVIVDLSLILIYPELFIAVLDAILFHNPN